MYRQDHKKLEANVHENTPSYTVWQLIKQDLLKTKGCQQLAATAPPGDLERKLQEWISDYGVNTDS